MRYHKMTIVNWLERSYRGWLWLPLLVLMIPMPVRAADPACGSMVFSNVKLAGDVHCSEPQPPAVTPASWITIGADNITIDLNGRIVQCSAPASIGFQGSCQEEPDIDHAIGINTNGHSNIRIINSNEDESGVIEGFSVGVWVQGGSNVRVSGIMITGPNNSAFPGCGAVCNPRPAAQAIKVTDVSCGMYTDPSDNANLLVKISKNTISNHSEGIELTNASCVKLQDNTVFNNNSDMHECHGIILEDSSYNNVTGNKVYGNGENAAVDGGLTATGMSMNNLITRNEVSDNNGDGISLRNGANGNTVQGNEMLFNGGDLFTNTVFFDAAARTGSPALTTGSSGGVNTWKDNECISQTAPEPPLGGCKEDEKTMKYPNPPR
jgi:parallel beta-helix repeat protein